MLARLKRADPAHVYLAGRMESQVRFLVSLLASTLGGVMAWFVYLQVLKLTASALSSPLVETGRVGSIFLQVAVTAVALFAAFGVLIAVLSQRKWWMHWLAFVAGIFICIELRFHPQGSELTIEVLRRIALAGAVLSSGIAAHLFSQYRDVSANR